MAEPKTEAEAVQLQPTGDYEFTQCPAYIPVATTSIHGNTDKPPSTQPTTAQDDQEDKIESGWLLFSKLNELNTSLWIVSHPRYTSDSLWSAS